MQAGHVAVAFVISSFAPEITGGRVDAFSAEAIGVSFAAHWLPNLDVVPIWLGITRKSFHCTWSHSIFFVTLVSLLVLPFDVGWAMLVFTSLSSHLLADMPSSIGLPLFLPLSKRRYTLNLWADTGYSGWATMKGTYQQSWTWILEGGAFLVLFVRAYKEGVWPFA
jgi:membrane-bound metal-dependent hydrolase YbcI (DUF457 family)